ncbi:hypothetical protein H7I77_09960 [Mycolicibacterium novocastrense]|uniref:Uncharacterized protein n=1 Tax=Mycolicibacterium novocastrense TaxID=59813 RepID=A0AAW5SJ74_MYCNV|nr:MULTISPECIES: hypothetical protein [Mycolicibacterium]MCV7023670.1 hypothetical protein [Mycolicibacterium novocastrense]MDX1886907.1 hypothetical protein [Mycolicibacterium sp. 120270]GAT07684.1 uncharacterized protein RMCN_0817 [Mycolicibacterium novocastrense]
MTWTAQLTYTAPGLTLEQRADIAAELDANVAYDEAAGHLKLTFETEGATLRQASDSALHAAGAAVSAVARGAVQTRRGRLLVMPTEEFIAEAAHPTRLDLIGLREIADQFGVSRQRAHQLTQLKTLPGGQLGFPEPVSTPASGPIFTQTSVDEFRRRWERTKKPQGGRPPRAAPGTDVEHGGAPAQPTRRRDSAAAR